MDRLRKEISYRRRGAALIIVLAMVVLLTGLAVAYLSRTTSDRQVAHSSFNQSKADELAASAMDNIIGDLRQEIANGSTNLAAAGATPAYSPAAAADMVPQRSGNAAGVPNLIRRSIRSDSPTPAPGLSSLASAVNSTTDASANGRSVTLARWNTHYLMPKSNTLNDDSYPVSPLLPPYNPYPAVANGFTPPDWVFVTSDTNNQTAGRKVITSPDQTVIGRYAYAVYDEGGLLDMNVAGYPTDPAAAPIPAQRVGRKGSLAFADLSALGTTDPYRLNNPDASGVYRMDMLVGWRNYATTQPTNTFPTTGPPANKAFAYNFQTDASATGPAALFYSYVLNNTNGFLSTSTNTWTVNNNTATRTDQSFVQRQELTAFRKAAGSTTSFSTNALQYLGTFSRETNSPSFSPSTPAGSTIDYAALSTSATAVNPNFLLRAVTPPGFTRFDGTMAVVGEPLVKTRFPLSRLAWITYKGPSAAVYAANNTDPIITNLTNLGVSLNTIKTGTAANIKACFGLTFGVNPGDPWIYTNPTGASAASAIMRLDQVVAANREPDFFELLQAGILSGSLGQNTAPPPGTSGGGTTGGNVFPDVHMSSTMQHLLTIGACIIDQASPESIPTRIQFSATVGAATHTWTAYGVKNLPYITQLYPIAGTSLNASTKWATYLLFQLWNPHQNAVAVSSNVRLRIDGGIGIFTGGNGQNWNTATSAYVYPPVGQVTSITLTSGSFSSPTALATDYVNRSTIPAGDGTVGTFAFLPSPAVPAPTP
jgi:Tfp pilus assembly protein PilX